jgi:hypothetical protein
VGIRCRRGNRSGAIPAVIDSEYSDREEIQSLVAAEPVVATSGTA